MFTVYVLYSPGFGKTYTGFTSDLKNRLLSHNELGTKGYTLRYRPWQVLHTEEFLTKQEALTRERELKSGKGRAFISMLISRRSVED